MKLPQVGFQPVEVQIFAKDPGSEADRIARRMVDLPEDTVKELSALASRKGTSRAELIRKATINFLESERSAVTTAERSRIFGLWKNEPMLDQELSLIRDEWDR